MIASRRFILQGALFGVACACAAVAAAAAQTPASPPKPGQKYVCPPCGCAADGKEFDAPGACPECGMPLVAKAADPKGRRPRRRSSPRRHGQRGEVRARLIPPWAAC